MHGQLQLFSQHRSLVGYRVYAKEVLLCTEYFRTYLSSGLCGYLQVGELARSTGAKLLWENAL